ncbi:SagB/ThcOx family dehydrogenase [Pelomyxa schiedti]|nr:SagB/ThcOx family dehydrogenase [Pelomyxa schiedti]
MTDSSCSANCVALPAAKSSGDGVSIEACLGKRRTARSFRPVPMPLSVLSQLLWSAQGVTMVDRDGDTYRTAPSAGALYPLELYVVTSELVENLSPGVYKYIPAVHSLELRKEGEYLNVVVEHAFAQAWIARAPVALILCAETSRTTRKYGSDNGMKYVLLEVGHAAENVALQAEALGLRGAMVGAMKEESVMGQKLNILVKHTPMLILPVGVPTE